MLYIAAILIALLGVGHSVLGERFILIRLFRRGELPALFGSQDLTRQTLRFAWHLTSVLGLGISIVLVQLADGAPPRAMALAIGWTLLISGLLPLIHTRGRHLSWIVLFAAGGLCIWPSM
jgi:hypothetical protein